MNPAAFKLIVVFRRLFLSFAMVVSGGIFASHAQEADRYYDFLIRNPPSHSEAVEFFRTIAPHAGFNFILEDVFQDPRLAEPVLEGAEFYYGYIKLLETHFGSDPSTLRWSTAPHLQLRLSFDQWRDFHSVSTSKSASPEAIKRLALDRVKTLYQLPGDTTESDILNPPAGSLRLHRVNNADEDSEHLRRLLVSAQHTYRQILYRYQNLSEPTRRPAEPDRAALSEWKNQMIRDIDRIRAKNFVTALLEHRKLNPPVYLSDLEIFDYASLWKFLLFPKRKEFSVSQELENHISFKGQELNSSSKDFYVSTNLSFYERFIRPPVHGFAKGVELLGVPLLSWLTKPNQAYQREKEKAAAEQINQKLGPEAGEQPLVRIRDYVTSYGNFEWVLRSLLRSTQTAPLTDRPSVHFVNEAIVREGALRDLRNFLMASAAESTQDFDQRLKRAEEQTAAISQPPQTLTEALRRQGILERLNTLQYLYWWGLAQHPRHWAIRDLASSGATPATHDFSPEAIKNRRLPQFVLVPRLRGPDGLLKIFSDAQALLVDTPEARLRNAPLETENLIKALKNFPARDGSGKVRALEGLKKIKDAMTSLTEKLAQVGQTAPLDDVTDKIMERRISIWWDLYKQLPQLFRPEQFPLSQKPTDVQNPKSKPISLRLKLADLYSKVSGWRKRMIVYGASVVTVGTALSVGNVLALGIQNALETNEPESPAIATLNNSNTARNKSIDELETLKRKTIFTIRSNELNILPAYFDTITANAVSENRFLALDEVRRDIPIDVTGSLELPHPSGNEIQIVSSSNYILNRSFALPTPAGFELKRIVFFDESSDENVTASDLKAEIHFDPTRKLYWIESDPQQLEGKRYFAQFLPAPENPNKKEYRVPSEFLKQTNQKMAEAGINIFYDKNQEDTMSLERVKQSLQNVGLYSYVKEGEPHPINKDNPFYEISRFVPSDCTGHIRYQCDGAAELAITYLRELHGGDQMYKLHPGVSIEARSTLLISPLESRQGSQIVEVPVSLGAAHRYVVIQDKDGNLHRFDSTPIEEDPRNWTQQRIHRFSVPEVFITSWNFVRTSASNLWTKIESLELPNLPEPSHYPDVALIGRTRAEDEEELNEILKQLKGRASDPTALSEASDETSKKEMVVKRHDARAQSLRRLKKEILENPVIQSMTPAQVRAGAPPFQALRISNSLIDYFENAISLETLRDELRQFGIELSEDGSESSTLADVGKAIEVLSRRFHYFRQNGQGRTEGDLSRFYRVDSVAEAILKLYSALGRPDFQPGPIELPEAVLCRNTTRILGAKIVRGPSEHVR